MDGQFEFILGKQESMTWSEGSEPKDNPLVLYWFGDKHVLVWLVCPSSGLNIFEPLDENPPNTFNFRLTHKCACWNGCGSNTTTHSPSTKITSTLTTAHPHSTKTVPSTTTTSTTEILPTTTVPLDGSIGISGEATFIITLLLLSFIYSRRFASY